MINSKILSDSHQVRSSRLSCTPTSFNDTCNISATLSGKFELQCRVSNKPYDIFGTWFNDNYLLSGNIYWRGNLASLSVISLNKVCMPAYHSTRYICQHITQQGKNASISLNKVYMPAYHTTRYICQHITQQCTYARISLNKVYMPTYHSTRYICQLYCTVWNS